MKSKKSQIKPSGRNDRLDSVLGALDKKAPGRASVRGSCTRWIYCV